VSDTSYSGGRAQWLSLRDPEGNRSMPTLNAFIVEDNPTILSNLVATLEELTDIRVVGSAATESAAVRGLREQAADLDLVIVDIFLSAGTGLGVLEAAQQMQMRARRVVLSNFATPELRRRCLALGATKVFDKSGELDALIEYCEKLAGV
jgi:DNA-binding NarL/FixJ family response regulator